MCFPNYMLPQKHSGEVSTIYYTSTKLFKQIIDSCSRKYPLESGWILIHLDVNSILQKSQRISMRSLQRTIIDSWDPKRKVMLSTIYIIILFKSCSHFLELFILYIAANFFIMIHSPHVHQHEDLSSSERMS